MGKQLELNQKLEIIKTLSQVLMNRMNNVDRELIIGKIMDVIKTI